MSDVPVECGPDDVSASQAYRPSLVRHHCGAVGDLLLVGIVEHGRTERDLVAASIWPFPRLILGNDYDRDHSVAIGVSAGGSGPAKLRSFEL